MLKIKVQRNAKPAAGCPIHHELAQCVYVFQSQSKAGRGSSPSTDCRDARIRLQIRIHLDLGHGRTFATDSGSSHRHRATATQEAKDDGPNEGSEQEPEECATGLEFVASLSHVW